MSIEGLKMRRAEVDDYEQVCEMFASAKVYEGTLRQHAFRDGRYVDSKVMGRLRPTAS